MTANAPRRTRGRPKPEDAAVIEDTLLTVALNEFLQCGYGGASMARIVKAAGVSKTTLYSRYASKEELFRATLQYKTLDLPAWNLLEAGTRSLPLPEVLIAYANHMLGRNLEGDLLAINQLIYSESRRFPELGMAVEARIKLGIQRVSAFIRERAISDGVPCKDPDSVAAAFIYMTAGWYATATMLSSRPVPEAERKQWVESAVRIFLSNREQW